MDTESSNPQNNETSSSPSVDIVMETPLQPQVTHDQGSLQTHTAELSFKAALVQPKRLSHDEIEKRIAEFGESDDEDEDMEDNDTPPTKSKIKITFSKERLQRNRAQWRGCLIIKLLGKNLGFKPLMDKIHRLWNLEGTITPIDVGLGFYIIRFETKADYRRVYMGGPWIIQDHYLTVRKWHSNFKADMALAIKTAVWVRVPLLPMEFYEEDNLKEIAEHLGKPLKVDNNTIVTARGSYARICVEMDLSKPLPPSIAVEKFDYYLEYEHLHLICFACGRVGHRRENCGAAPAIDKPGIARETNVDSHIMADTKSVRFNGQIAPDEATEIGFGEWMVVARRPKRNQAQINNNSRNVRPNDHSRAGHKNQVPNLNQQRHVKGKGPVAQQSSSVKQNKPNTNAQIQNGSRFSPLVEQASTSSPTLILEQPTPVLIPIARKTPQYNPKHLHSPSIVSAAAQPKPTPNPTTIPQPGQVPQVSLHTKPPELASLTTATYHEHARNAETDAQGRQGEEDLRSRDRSTSPHRDRMVGGRGQHENKDKRGYRRGPISAQGETQTSVETPSLS